MNLTDTDHALLRAYRDGLWELEARVDLEPLVFAACRLPSPPSWALEDLQRLGGESSPNVSDLGSPAALCVALLSQASWLEPSDVSGALRRLVEAAGLTAG